jgi:hypothetical protein
MTSLIKSTRALCCIEYGIDNVDAYFEGSLQRALEKKISLQFEDDFFELIKCDAPNCNAIHAIRYFFNDGLPDEVDILDMKIQMHQAMSEWFMSSEEN